MYEKVSIDSSKYVVLDVETNGLSAKKDDLLSLSIFKPDDGKEYNRFLPLELSKYVKTTRKNGIVTDDLIGAVPLTQREFNQIVEVFELDKRIILTYSGGKFDEGFLKEYLRRHRIRGYENFNFYNFKRQIISSRYSDGNISKDNLCRLFKIDNVEDIHTSANDCKLEWKLFEKMGGDYYLVTGGEGSDNVFRLTPDYIIPVGLLSSHPNLGKLLKNRPFIDCKSEVIKTFTISAEGIDKFETNFNGMIIEHLINTMLKSEEVDSMDFLIQNKCKLEYIGQIPNDIQIIPMVFNPDGTVTAVKKKDTRKEKSLNSTIEQLKNRIQPLVDYIKNEVFKGNPIKSQELVIDRENNILALCDLSSETKILEIKTNDSDPMVYREQLYYEANGRECYYLCIEWVKDHGRDILTSVKFKIFTVDVYSTMPDSDIWTEGKRAAKRAVTIERIKKYLEGTDIGLCNYINSSLPVEMKCNVCGKEWSSSYSTLMKKKPECKFCHQYVRKLNRETMSAEERKNLRASVYIEKIIIKSNGGIIASNYEGAKDNVDAKCTKCGHKWSVRADHLVDRCWCPSCRNNKG